MILIAHGCMWRVKSVISYYSHDVSHFLNVGSFKIRLNYAMASTNFEIKTTIVVATALNMSINMHAAALADEHLKTTSLV